MRQHATGARRRVALLVTSATLLAACGGAATAERKDPSTSPIGTFDATAARAGAGGFPTATTVASPAAADPAAAVTAFLDAERTGDTDASYALLAQDDRTQSGSPAAWAEARVNRPRITSSSVGTVTTADDAHASVTAEVSYEPRLDMVVGMVPASATVTFSTVRQEGGWRVAASASSSAARLPSDAGAAVAALAYAASAQRCEQPASTYAGSLLYSPSLGSALCGTTAALTAGPPRSASTLADTTALLSAFGEGAMRWARVVEIDGPAQLDVITGPLGDHWVVVGVTAH